MEKTLLRRYAADALAIAVAVCMTPVYAHAASYSDSSSGGHAILVSGVTKTISKAKVKKTGNSSSEDADFYGTNAAVLVTNGGTLNLKNSYVYTNGSHANGVFSYGSGTTVNVYKTKIKTKSNNSGGIMTTGGGTMNAKYLTVRTYGNSSAAIRSDRGGGDVNVTKGTYKTSGTGSPAIYSTADIDVTGAKLTSTKSEAMVIEGGNSITLNKCNVTGNNTTKNGQAKYLNNVLIYQSMSGDASTGASAFTMNGGTMTSKSGAMFHVTNTTCVITLKNAVLNLDDGMLLTESADSWGTAGSNGGNVTLKAVSQKLKGTVTVDSSSSLALELQSSSSYSGKINTSGQSGTVSVSVASGCKWTLTGDSCISSLTNNGTIDTNGHTLYVNGIAYTG